MLASSWFPRRAWRGRRQRLLELSALLASGAFHSFPWSWLLAAAPRCIVRCSRQIARQTIALGRPRRGLGNGSFSPADCWIYRRSLLKAGNEEENTLCRADSAGFALGRRVPVGSFFSTAAPADSRHALE